MPCTALISFERIKVLAILVVAVMLYAPQASAQAAHTSAEQAIIIDFDTGMTLFEKNADQQVPPSSMSKVLTMYAVFSALKEGQISMDTELLVSEKAWRKGGSKMFVEVGHRLAVSDLIRGVIVQSGNDATIVLAEGIAGSVEAFADILNNIALRLGMENSHFVNASGWPHPEHYSTARDLAILGQRIIQDFPELYHHYSEEEFTYNNIKQRNRNPLLYRDIGADGIKTGFTNSGKYGLMGSGTRDGRRVVMVINGVADARSRAQEGARLLEWGLRGFENVQLFTADTIVAQAPVAMGRQQQVPLVVADDLTITIPRAVRNDLKVEVRFDGPITAPVVKGDHIGTLYIDIPRLENREVPLYAGTDVEELGFMASLFAKLKLLAGNTGTAIQ